MKELLKNFEVYSCLMNLELHFSHSHVDYLAENLGDCSEEWRKRFHQDFRKMEKWYQGTWGQQDWQIFVGPWKEKQITKMKILAQWVACHALITKTTAFIGSWVRSPVWALVIFLNCFLPREIPRDSGQVFPRNPSPVGFWIFLPQSLLPGRNRDSCVGKVGMFRTADPTWKRGAGFMFRSLLREGRHLVPQKAENVGSTGKVIHRRCFQWRKKGGALLPHRGSERPPLLGQ